ncbi:glutamyl-tRNA reductase [Salinisphaera sp. USBA-960]|uniref:glutamyl-tRNA reductase n=1 Tax=Salinisphaera orenii TaxID=856731 RepID=UPI000DBEA60C|nr:glutamyl-tRNA reductase [Salifodinibacter halophilus]NNC25461.1 glutamyl-tRNA reductase [Salifodinibacter halophilus]
MSLVSTGISHHSAPLSVRESVALGADEFSPALSDLLARTSVDEAVVLSTCNRTEIYAAANTPADVDLAEWLCDFRGLDYSCYSDYFYRLSDRETVVHSLRVAAGLDSLVVGESQILGQMKQALENARRFDGVGPVITRLFEHSFSAAKYIRTATDIGANPVSVAYTSAQLAGHVFPDLAAQRVLLVGAGDNIELIARYLADIGLTDFTFANRNRERAEALTERFGGQTVDFEAVDQAVTEADLLISSTAASDPIIGADTIESAIHARQNKPIFVLDLAVPRDIDPAAGALDHVHLWSIDDLQEVIDDNYQARQDAAQAADAMIRDRAEQYLEWVDSRQATDTIRALRENAHQTRDDVIARAKRRLARGESPEAVIDYLGNTLTNRLIHAPTVALRKASDHDRQRLLRPAEELFDIDAGANRATRGNSAGR